MNSDRYPLDNLDNLLHEMDTGEPTGNVRQLAERTALRARLDGANRVTVEPDARPARRRDPVREFRRGLVAQRLARVVAFVVLWGGSAVIGLGICYAVARAVLGMVGL